MDVNGRQQITKYREISNLMAERVGFEPTLPFRVNTLSKRAPSATRPSLPRHLTEAEVHGFGQRFPTAQRLMSILWAEAKNRKVE